MEQQRPYVLSLAGLDPSGGAGILADIKTFEMQQVYGLGVCTAITVQTATQFLDVRWVSVDQIIAQLEPLLSSYQPQYCKIGLTEHVGILKQVLEYLHHQVPGIKVILDPVLSASAGYTFHDQPLGGDWQSVLPLVYLLTPNYNEAIRLTGMATGEEASAYLSRHCAVLLKGGHRPTQMGSDTLYQGGTTYTFNNVKGEVYDKHGSGCVLSAAIAGQLAKGKTLLEACHIGKVYTAKFLASHHSLTGYHYI